MAWSTCDALYDRAEVALSRAEKRLEQMHRLHLAGAGVGRDAHGRLQRLLSRDGPLVESHSCPLLGSWLVKDYCSRVSWGVYANLSLHMLDFSAESQGVTDWEVLGFSPVRVVGSDESRKRLRVLGRTFCVAGRHAALSRVVGNNAYAKPPAPRHGIKPFAQSLTAGPRREGPLDEKNAHLKKGAPRA